MTRMGGVERREGGMVTVTCTSTHLTSFAVLVDITGEGVSPISTYRVCTTSQPDNHHVYCRSGNFSVLKYFVVLNCTYKIYTKNNEVSGIFTALY